MTIRQALAKVSELEKRSGKDSFKRDDLIEMIGEELCDTLNVLGYITHGTSGKIRVCRRTGERSLAERFAAEPTYEEKRLGYIITHR